MLFPHIISVCPILKSLLVFFLTDIEDVLSVFATRLLQAPSGGVVEVKRVGHMASGTVLLDVVALFDIGERGPCLLHGVSVDVV